MTNQANTLLAHIQAARHALTAAETALQADGKTLLDPDQIKETIRAAYACGCRDMLPPGQTISDAQIAEKWENSNAVHFTDGL